MPFAAVRPDPGQDPPWAEENGSPVFQVGTDTISCERTIRCAWKDRFDIARAFRYTGYDVEGKLVDGALECRDPIVIRGVARQGQAEFGRSEYEQATLQIRYASSARHFEVEYESQPEFLTEDPKLFAWKKVEGGTTTYVPILKGEAPGRLLFQGKISFNLYPSDDGELGPFDIKPLEDASGRVNHEEVNLSGIVAMASGIYAAETLLLSVGRSSFTLDPFDGFCRWKIPITFFYKPNIEEGNELGWNYFWRATTGKYEQMYRADGSSVHKPYPTVDFTTLFENILAYVPDAPVPAEEEEE
jgi:hypothetical protein